MSIDFSIFNQFKETETLKQHNNIFYDFCVNTMYANVNEDDYTIIMITGKPGSGKSVLSIEAAVYTQKYASLRYKIEAPFSIKNIFFDLSDFFEALSSRNDIKNNIFILDDPNIDIFLTKENQKFNDYLRTARTQHIMLIITEPSTKNLPLVTVRNYVKIVFFIKKRDKNNQITLIPRRPVFQFSRDLNNEEEMQLATARDLMISKVRINSLPFNIRQNIAIRSITVPSLTDKIDEFPDLPFILKEYRNLREQKPEKIIKKDVDEKKEYLETIQNVVKEINENEEYKKMIISKNIVNKNCIKEIFKVSDAVATLVKNYLSNTIKETKTYSQETKIKEEDKKNRKRDKKIEIELEESRDIISNFIEDLKKDNIMSKTFID